MKRTTLTILLSALSINAFAQQPPAAPLPAPSASPVQQVSPPAAPPSQAPAPVVAPVAVQADGMLEDGDKRTLREISKMQIDLKLKALMKESKKLDFEIDQIDRNSSPPSTPAVPEDPQFVLTGVYGETGDLRAEIRLFSGGKFTVASKSVLPDGFFVKSITSNSITVTKGPKGRKEFVIWMVGAARGTSSTPSGNASASGLPPIPAAAVSFPGSR